MQSKPSGLASPYVGYQPFRLAMMRREGIILFQSVAAPSTLGLGYDTLVVTQQALFMLALNLVGYG